MIKMRSKLVWMILNNKKHFYSLDKSFVSFEGVQFKSDVTTGVAVGAGGSGAKSKYVIGTPITTLPF